LRKWQYSTEVGVAPGTSSFVSNKGGSGDEMHIVVVDEDGKFTGVANTVLEKYTFVSKASDSITDSGDTNYYKTIVNSQSQYIWWLGHLPGSVNWGNTAFSTTFTNLNTPQSNSLSAGADGTIGNSEIITAYGYFANADVVDVSLLISGPGNATVATSLISTAESRKDVLVFLSPTKANVVNNAGSEATSILSYRNSLTSSSYAVLDSGYKYQFDKYNNVYRWVPLNADIAGTCARTDLERDPWYSPGGLNRGVIKNVIKLAYNPDKTDRDNLYVQGINPVVSFQGEGTVLFGDKTLLSRPSAFDRINVRRLFIVLEKSISKAARSTLFEYNDQFTRAQFVNLVEPFLRDVQGRRGITDFRVVCDNTNNTPEVIDGNRFVGDIYIKPARSINFIQLNFVAVRTGVSFDEIVGRF
jgi:phage tail sheath protein FI